MHILIDVTNKLISLWTNFLSKGSPQKSTWVLVGWHRLTLPKKKGGLGLCDPTITSLVYARKLRCLWVQGGSQTYKEIWLCKYLPLNTQVEQMRFDGKIKGLGVWYWAFQTKGLVKQNAFWEIRNGTTAAIWEEPLHQHLIMNKFEKLQSIK